jgi:sRNA-binding protein
MADKKNGAHGAGSAATETGRRRQKIAKVEAVRRAMTALGEDATRTDIQGYVRQKFGVKIGLDHISNCKGELAKRAAKATTPAGLQAAAAKPAAAPAMSRKPTAPKTRAAQRTPAPHTRQAGGNGSSRASILLEDVLTAKLLIDRVGAGPLKTLIDGLAK